MGTSATSTTVASIRRGALRAVLSGTALGVVWVSVLTAWSSPVTLPAGLRLFALAIGAVLGVVATGLTFARSQLRDRPPNTGARGAMERLGVVIVLHLWIAFGGMARSPALYSASWYARGGWRRTVEIFATDVLGPRGIAFLGLVILAGYVLGRPARWPSYGERARDSLASLRPMARRTLPPSASLSTLALITALACLASGGVSACSARPRPASERPNVLLVAVESLRADRIDPRVAPNLTALAGRGTRFDRAYVSAPRTLPSWVTLLTGRHPHHHGVRSELPTAGEPAADLDALPARLTRAGYDTAVLADDGDGAFHRASLGFSLVDAPRGSADETARRRALTSAAPLLPFLDARLGRDLFPAMRGVAEAGAPDLLADRAITTLDRLRDHPFFLTVAFSSVRAPYAAKAPWYARFTRAAYRGRFKYAAPASPGGERADADDVAQARGLYDGAVASVDAAIARVLAALERRGLRDDTIVVLTSPHGETLFERGRARGHGEHLFGDEGTHVPLIVVDPRRRRVADRVDAVVRDVDLAPTLYALTGVEPPSDLDGRSLEAALGGASLTPAFAYAETGPWLGAAPEIPGAPRFPVAPHDPFAAIDRVAEDATLVASHRMVRDDRWKLLYAPTRAAPAYLLFDTGTDPGEARDLASTRPDELARMKGALWSWMLADPRMTQRGALLVPRDGPPRPTGREVATRLVDALGEARVDAPSAHAAEPIFAAHTRKTSAPWAHLGGDGARLATRVTLPDADGALDARDALYAPAPATLTFHVRVPHGARLSFAPATLNRTHDTVLFTVSFTDARGASHDVYARRVPPARERRWLDDQVDLSPFAGESIDLRLRTLVIPASPEERRAAFVPRAPHAAPGPGGAKAHDGATAAERLLATPAPLALALWGDPVILTDGETTVPYDVLWVVASSFHPGPLPALDALAARGVAFTHAYSPTPSLGPAAFAMLAGARPTEVGLDVLHGGITDADLDRASVSSPSFLPTVLRGSGVVTRAFATDHGATESASVWIKTHAAERFAVAFELTTSTRANEAIGELLAAVDAAGLRERTLVIVTAARSPQDPLGAVPLVVSLPGQLAPRVVDARVRAIDLAPTVLDLESLDAVPARAAMSGASLAALARGASEPDPRPVVVESRGARSLVAGTHQLVVRDPPAPPQLFDLDAEPAARRDLARDQPDLVAEMRARLDAALANVPVAGTAASLATSAPRAGVSLRFAGAGTARRVSGRITARGARLAVDGVALGPESWKVMGDAVDVAFTTAPDGVVGLDVRVDPATAPISWALTLDDDPWPADRVYAGPFGLATPRALGGLTASDVRAAARGPVPWIDPARDLGLFVSQ